MIRRPAQQTKKWTPGGPDKSHFIVARLDDSLLSHPALFCPGLKLE
jgi:hypothetical protein